MSIPFFNEEFVFHQPDGTEIRLRGTGDEDVAVFETLDGYTVLKNPVTGFYEYAAEADAEAPLVPMGAAVSTMTPADIGMKPGVRPQRAYIDQTFGSISPLPKSPRRWEERRRERLEELRRSASNLAILPTPPQRQTIGSFIGLCLLIQFPDVKGSASRDEVERFCNASGYSGYGNRGSVRDYFEYVSSGKVKFTHLVMPYYTAKHKRSYYTDRNVPYGQRARELILEALEFHLGAKSDFTSLSVDDKSYVYAMSIFYAGARENAWSEGLWPHAHHLQTKKELTPGKYAFDYQITDMTDELRLGTFCHENGHMLCDFPDLYDKKAPKSYGIGKFCLMCSGGNADPKNPTLINGYLRSAAGWVDDLIDLKPGTQVSLEAGKNQFGIFRKSETEYFLLEVRQAVNRDAALPASGLAIWHVDELGDNSNEERKPLSHYECSLMQADGKFHLEGNVNQGDNGDLFRAGHADKFSDTTAPNSRWWDGKASGLRIEAISAAGPIVTFKVVEVPSA